MKRYLSNNFKKVITTLFTLAALAIAPSAFATSTFTVSATNTSGGCNFTITRTGNTSIKETVKFRTVSLTALAGQHFTEKTGTVTFSANQTTKTVNVTETDIADVEANYRFQTGTTRSYRFEVLDKDGYVLAYDDREMNYNSKYTIFTSDFNEKTVSVSSAETTAGDGGYGSNPYLTMASSSYYNIAAAQDYLSASNMELHMTLDFQAKEVEDGYQYLQILFDPTNNGYDDRPSNASNGDPGTPNLSHYMAGFEHQHGSTNTNYASYSFPVTSVGNNAGADAPWNTSPWNNSIGKLSIQKFNTSCRATDGRLLIPTDFTELVLRFNASGSGGDDWTLKSVVAKIQAVDNYRPTVLPNYTVSGGRHQKGNTIYVSVPFSEIVYITGDTKKLITSWGDLTYIAGNGTNVLTFQGEISSSASGSFNVTGYSGVIKDMADLQFNGSISCDFGIGLNSDYVWSPSDFHSLGSNTYEIATTTDLRHLALMVDGAYNDCSGLTFQQTADIAFNTDDLESTDENFITIGGYFNGSDKNFKGTYDGQNHTISGIRLYKNGTVAPSMNQGLFGRIDGATIQNVILTDARITGYRYVGGLVGNKVSGTVQNCLVLESTITCANTYVGALFGKNTGTLTTNHYPNCTVNGTDNATNVGVGNGSSSNDINGARSMHPLTIQNTNVTATGESVTYQNTTYYASNTTITLGYNNLPAGYQVTYSLNGTALSGNTFTMPANDNATVNASTSLITYTIAYNLDGGSATNPTTYTIETPTFTLTNPTKTGYTFIGWTGTDLTQPTQTVTIAQGSTGNRSYTANWIQNYTITYNLNGGSVTPANPTTYNIQTPTFTLNNPTNTGYTFDGWTGTGLTQPTLTVTITQGSTGNRSYTANWTPITYNITYDLDGGSVATANPTTYTIETPTFTLNNPTKTGYTFAGWTGSNGTTPQTTVTITQGSMGDRSYTAHWTPTTYNITYDLDGGSATNPTTYTIETPTFTLNNPTKTGYTFDGWTGTGLTQPTLTVTITQGSTGDLSYTAHWTIITYNITYDLDGGTVATANPTTYDVETPTFTLTNPTKVTYNFDGWTGSNGQTPETTVTITQGSTGDLSYTAHWTPFAYALSLGEDITASGIVALTYNGINYYAPGTEITLAYSGTIPEGYSPAYSVNGTAIVGNTFEMPATDVVVEAVLLERYYIYNSTTGELALLWGAFNKDNKWGSDVPIANVTSVTATSDVSFTGNCSNLFTGFSNCTSMDLSNVNTDALTFASNMFSLCSSLSTLDLSGWDVSNVTNMLSMFYNCSSLTTLDFSGWNTASVTTMTQLFYNCQGLDSLDLSDWNTANVTNMTDMFHNCLSLQSLDLSDWNTGNVTNMSYMFYGCSGLASLDISDWNTASVTTMTQLFYNCQGLDSLNISGWNTANVTKMNYMFENCSSLTSLDLSDWNTSNVTDMSGMFEYCSSLTTLNLSGWNTVKVTSMHNMFHRCSNLTMLDLSGWNTGNVTRMDYLFNGCGGLQSLDLSDWNTVNVTDMNYMFSSCSGLQSLNLSGWNTANVTDMNRMFNSCSGLQSLNLSGWNTANVTSMERMFYRCSGLQSLDLSGWNTANVTNMGYMFDYCSGLTTINLSGWNIANVNNMHYMFESCSSLQSLDLSDWNTPTGYMPYMFRGCSNLTTIYVGKGWNTERVPSGIRTFEGCTNLVGGMGTQYDEDYTDAEYARIDKGPNSDQPGYLTGVFALTLADDITASPAATLTHGDVNLYAVGTTITLTYSGEVPEGYAPIYSVNGNHISDNTFAMPFEDATITVDVQPVRYTYDSATGELALLWCEFNKDFKWGNDVPIAEVTSVTATDEVSFTGDCSNLFAGFSNCTSMDLSNVNTDNVTNMTTMFANCTSLNTLDLSNWNTASVTTMLSMFINCTSLETLDLSTWNTSDVTQMYAMFCGCTNLTTIYAGTGWNTDNVTGSTNMFLGCTNLVGGMGTEYNPDHTDAEYARIDGSPDNPGYFTGMISQTLAAGWNWWTPLIEISVNALQTALGTNLIGIKSETGPVVSGDLVPGQLYKIQTSAACTLQLTGTPVTSVSVTFQQGVNWFGYTGADNLPIAFALGSFTPALGDKIVSQNDGFVLFTDNGWEGTLPHLVPGQGYVYVSTNNTRRTWTMKR